MINDKILKTEERVAFALRSLYTGFGYTRFKMNKFEEYDLYAKNKDSLISEGIITFTDTSGKLLALKPDVTLSIIKNSPDKEGAVQKLYYDENVYRISQNSHSFKEIAQTGLECIGDIGVYEVCEVLNLGINSLELIDENYILDISHAGLLAAVLNESGIEGSARKTVQKAVQTKSKDAVKALLEQGAISALGYDTALKLISNYKDFGALQKAFGGYESDDVKCALAEFLEIGKVLEALGKQDKINIDFSIVSDTGYYSGVVFKGYIKGIPTEVLVGGRYDKLMRRMGRRSGAVGFAVYLDVLERHNPATAEYDYDYAIIKGEGAGPAELIKKVYELTAGGSTAAVFKKLPEGVRCREVVKL